MTNPIAPDTCSTSFNPLKTWRGILGKWALLRDLSFGKSVIYLVEKGAETEDPELARKLRAARLQRYCSVICLGFGLIFTVSAYIGEQDTRRPRPRPRASRARVHPFKSTWIQAA